MKTKKILLQIINELDAFEKSTNNLSYYNFVNYLSQKKMEIDYPKKVLSDNSEVEELKSFKENNERDVTILITFMFKYAKNYLKKALETSVISTPDEFAFLITMMRKDSLSKTELINLLVTEKTSGTETIKRLIKKGLLSEFKIIEDKKSVHVKITEDGRQSIIEVIPEIEKVTKIVAGNLTDDEIKILSYLLSKLDDFHNEIYFKKKALSIDEIYNYTLDKTN